MKITITTKQKANNSPPRPTRLNLNFNSPNKKNRRNTKENRKRMKATENNSFQVRKTGTIAQQRTTVIGRCTSNSIPHHSQSVGNQVDRNGPTKEKKKTMNHSAKLGASSKTTAAFEKDNSRFE